MAMMAETARLFAAGQRSVSRLVRAGLWGVAMLSGISAFAASKPARWIGTWAAAPQQLVAASAPVYENQTLRLIVHVSAGGKKVRIRFSNTFGDEPVRIGAAHVARRSSGAGVEPSSDRALTFGGSKSATIAAHGDVLSDPVELEVPALSDLAISFFLPQSTRVTTTHILAKQTNYLSAEPGDTTAEAELRVGKTIGDWPLLTGVEVEASAHGAAIVALGSSLTDGDGSTKDTNRRWPDVLAERLQKEGSKEMGVLNEGVIGNRLMNDTDSPRQTGGPLAEAYAKLGPNLGQAGVRRFDRDVLEQAGVKYVILGLGVNDILFPGSFIDGSEAVTAQALIAANRQLVARAHRKHIKAIGTTIPPFEHALFRSPAFDQFYTPEKEKTRQEVNEWIRNGGAFDGVIDFDAAVRDPNHPAQILPAFDSGDHLHVNNEGNVAQGKVIDLSLFRR